jgi:hypothetical protein
MPERIWSFPCCDTTSRNTTCSTCGKPGVFAGWSLTVADGLKRFQRAYGLDPLGPQVRWASWNLGPMRSQCESCNGVGIVGDVHEWRECQACEGGGAVWSAPEEELVKAYLNIVEEWPDAAMLGALSAHRLLPDWTDTDESRPHTSGPAPLVSNVDASMEEPPSELTPEVLRDLLLDIARGEDRTRILAMETDDEQYWFDELTELVWRLGEQVLSLDWDSGSPGAGAGTERVYQVGEKFLTASLDFGWGGPYDTLEQAFCPIWVSEATTAIWCSEWTAEEIIARMEMVGAPPVLSLNEEDWPFEVLEHTYQKLAGQRSPDSPADDSDQRE